MNRKKENTDTLDETSQINLSPESNENYLISLAMRCVEQRLKDGTASAQEVTHFLKLGSTKDRLEKEILEEQKELIKAKTESLQAAKHADEMFSKVVEAMKRYNGLTDDENEY